MRIVAGKYRGKSLISPLDDRVRPTTTRIKETLFNVLQGYVEDAVVLDLFAGSGALGIECISRGAAEVTFVDKSKDSISLVHRNLNGISGNYEVVLADYTYALRSAAGGGKKFDIIFIDPPYASGLGEEAVSLIFELGLLSDDGVIVFEHGSEKEYILDNPRYVQRTKKMGTVTADFIRRKHVALMAGSFDPITRGHEVVLSEALKDYDEVVVACLINPEKRYHFSPAQRLALVQAVCNEHRGARAVYSEKMAVEVAAEVGAEVLIRGVRDVSDEGYEADMAAFNRAHGYETEFIALDGYKDVSSTRVRAQIEEGNYKNVPFAALNVLLSDDFKALK